MNSDEVSPFVIVLDMVIVWLRLKDVRVGVSWVLRRLEVGRFQLGKEMTFDELMGVVG